MIENLSPCFTSGIRREVDGVVYSVAISQFGHALVAHPDPSAQEWGVNDGSRSAPALRKPPDETLDPLIRAAMGARTEGIALGELLNFCGPPCETCGDSRTVDCEPCDLCDWDGWDICDCATSKSRPARGFPATSCTYEAGLLGATLRSMRLQDDASVSVGEALTSPDRKYRMLVIRSTDGVIACVAENKSTNGVRTFRKAS